MIDTLKKVQKIVNAIMKVIPAIIEMLQDLADDGQLNDSAKSK